MKIVDDGVRQSLTLRQSAPAESSRRPMMESQQPQQQQQPQQFVRQPNIQSIPSPQSAGSPFSIPSTSPSQYGMAMHSTPSPSIASGGSGTKGYIGVPLSNLLAKEGNQSDIPIAVMKAVKTIVTRGLKEKYFFNLFVILFYLKYLLFRS